MMICPNCNAEISDEYLLDLEEECENLSEHNRMLTETIKELEKCINSK